MVHWPVELLKTSKQRVWNFYNQEFTLKQSWVILFLDFCVGYFACVCVRVHVSFHLWMDQCVLMQLGPIPLSVQFSLCVWPLEFCYLVSCSQCSTLKQLCVFVWVCVLFFFFTQSVTCRPYISLTTTAALLVVLTGERQARVCEWEHVHVCETTSPVSAKEPWLFSPTSCFVCR